MATWKERFASALSGQDPAIRAARKELARCESDRSVAALLLRSAETLRLAESADRWRHAYTAETYHIALESLLEDFRDREIRYGTAIRGWDTQTAKELDTAIWSTVSLIKGISADDDNSFLLPPLLRSLGGLLEVVWIAPYDFYPFRQESLLFEMVRQLPRALPIEPRTILLVGRFALVYEKSGPADRTAVEEWMAYYPIIRELLGSNSDR